MYELADKNLVLVLNPTDKKYCRKETGPANEVTVPELENPATVHVFDSKSGACGYEPSISVCRTIMFSSANASSYRQRERSFATVVYPSPSLHEMLAAADVFGLNPADVQRKYVKFGGSMRWVFGMTERMAEARLQQAVRALNIDDILSITQGAVSSDVTRSSGAPTALFTASVKPAHMKLLVKLAEAAEREEEAAPAAEGEAGLEGKEWTVSAGGEQKTGAGEAEEVEEAAVLPMRRRGELLIVYEESSIVWRISTEYIFDLLRRSAGDSIGKFVRRFVTAAKESATLGVARGNTLQVAAPDLLAEGKALPSRDLRTRAEGKYPFGHKRNVVLVQWKTVEEVLKNCKDENTVYVINGSLPGFDIYLPPNIFVQSTSVITARHPINLEAAAQICAHCDAKGQPTEFLFLVPADTFHLWRNPQSFAYTPHKQLRLAGLALADQERVKSLHQSVLCLDLDKWVLAAEDLDAA